MTSVNKRIIPCLQLIDESLVKAEKFKRYNYIGDPCNTVRIFNELEVDELCFLDIRASKENRMPNFELLHDISNECFMPLSYGGGVSTFDQAVRIFEIGFEKLVLNTNAFRNQQLVCQISKHFGVQSIIVSVDYYSGELENIYINDGRRKEKIKVIDYCLKMQDIGAGEILLTCMDKEGTWSGYDIDNIKEVSNRLSIPVIANGGCGKPDDIAQLFNNTNAQAAAVGSMFVYQKKGMGVLVNMPKQILEIRHTII